jgi:hypothetical protein
LLSLSHLSELPPHHRSARLNTSCSRAKLSTISLLSGIDLLLKYSLLLRDNLLRI